MALFPHPQPDWLAQSAEPAIDPARPIVDPHHHLWDWPAWRYLLPDLLADTGQGHRIIGTVYVEARAMYRAGGPKPLRPVGETEFANGVAAMAASGLYGETLACDGIVGRADLLLGDAVQEVLDAHVRAGMGRFKGVRNQTARDDDPALRHPDYSPPAGLLGDARFREGFARLEPNGLSFDCWIYHPQLPELASLAAAFPGTTIVLDHCGGPLGVGSYAGRDIFAGWAASIREVAACGNVVMKLGGLGMWTAGFGFHDQPAAPGSEQLAAAWRPYFETCIDAFGPARCMFESNFPVDKCSTGYGVFWNACKRFAAGFSAGEQDDLFRGVATRTYRLPS